MPRPALHSPAAPTEPAKFTAPPPLLTRGVGAVGNGEAVCTSAGEENIEEAPLATSAALAEPAESAAESGDGESPQRGGLPNQTVGAAEVLRGTGRTAEGGEGGTTATDDGRSKSPPIDGRQPGLEAESSADNAKLPAILCRTCGCGNLESCSEPVGLTRSVPPKLDGHAENALIPPATLLRALGVKLHVSTSAHHTSAASARGGEGRSSAKRAQPCTVATPASIPPPSVSRATNGDRPTSSAPSATTAAATGATAVSGCPVGC